VPGDLPHRAAFPTTRITLIEAACGAPGDASHQAIAILCSSYWYPTYAYVRRLGHPHSDAEDLTQGFFTRVLDKHYLRDFQRERGRFRSFLLAALQHFLANERDRALALKRGGGRSTVPLDDLLATAEQRYSLEPRDDLTPERLYERQWALTLLARVEQRLHQEAVSAGTDVQYSRLKICLTPDERAGGYRALAAELGTTEGAVKVAVHRLRRRFRELLRDEIAHTVLDAGEVGDELRHLMEALSGRPVSGRPVPGRPVDRSTGK